MDSLGESEEKIVPDLIGMGEGTHLYWPFGFMPIVVGNDSSPDKSPASGFVSYVIQYIFDPKATEAPDVVQSSVRARLESALALKLKVFKNASFKDSVASFASRLKAIEIDAPEF